MTAPKIVSRTPTTLRVETLPASETRPPGFHRILVACPCATTTITAPSWVHLADAMKDARDQHAKRVGRGCPHVKGRHR